MTRRRLLLIGTVACLLVATPFVVRWALTPAPGPTLENFKRLRAGMSWEQAKDILGPTDHHLLPNGAVRNYWTAGDEEILVWEDSAGRVEDGIFVDYRGRNWKIVRPEETVMDRLRRWFGL